MILRTEKKELTKLTTQLAAVFFDHVWYAMQDQEMTYEPCSDSLGSKPTDMLISAQHDVMVSHKL